MLLVRQLNPSARILGRSIWVFRKPEFPILNNSHVLHKRHLSIGDNGDGRHSTMENKERGWYEFADGAIYEGDFLQGKLHGKGKVVYPSGDSYEGDFVDGHFHGQGITKVIGVETHVGEYENGRRSGRGTLTCHNGDLYEGMFVNDLVHGTGVLRCANGDVQSGEFKEGQFVSGECQFANGEKYVGELRDGAFNGFGTYTCNDYVFEGNHVNNEREGFGVLRYADGKVFKGHFKNSAMHGRGEWNYPSGAVFTLEYDNDVCNGVGEVKFPNGDTYRQAWIKGICIGNGLYRRDNKRYSCCLESLIHITCEWTYSFPDGTKMEGRFLSVGEESKPGWGWLFPSNMSVEPMLVIMEGEQCTVVDKDDAFAKKLISKIEDVSSTNDKRKVEDDSKNNCRVS